MRRSVLFTRVFSVVILTILMTALFTTFIYTYISQSVFTQIRENELLPKARALGKVLVRYGNAITRDDGLVRALVGMEPGGESLFGAYVVITDDAGRVILSSDGMRADYLSALADAAKDVLKNGELRTAQIPALTRSGMVGVGVPVERASGDVAGVVMILMPLYEAMVAMGSLNGALALSLLLSLPFVAALVYYVIGRIVRPLRQMRDVALKMAGGSFEARADTSQRGEIGQLGRSLNYLSQELSRSISALVLEKNRLQQTLDGLREGIAAVDEQGRVTHHNPALKNLFAALAPEPGVEGKLALIPDENVWADIMGVVASGNGLTKVLPLPDRTLLLSVSPLLSEESGIAGAVALFSDVTESERLERTRRDYVANVSHEMRTPLTAMRALLEPLTEGMVTDEANRRRYYSIMLRETMRLSRLIDDLMELSRLQSGKLTVEISPLLIQDAVEELTEKYSAIAQDHALSFCVDVPADCPPVISNADRVEEILVILLDNAMKYTPEGGKVTIGAAWDESRVTVFVRDTGIGIDPADLPYVFDRFYKADKAHTGLGSGLGLSIASELIRVLDGRIGVKSEPGKGSTFYFALKREPPIPAPRKEDEP